MSQIIIDNWTLQRAAVNINNSYEGLELPNQDYAALIEAIILWDDVCYFENEYTKTWQNILWRFEYGKYLRGCPNELEDTKKLGIVEGGALAYWQACNKIGASYLLTEERVRALQQVPSYKHAYNRANVMRQVDNRLAQHYNELNELFGANFWDFSFPALFDFVKNNTADSRSYINTAMQIRNSLETKLFRAWLNNFDDELKSNNPFNATKHMSELTNIIDTMSKKFGRSYSIMTSVGIPWGLSASLPEISLSRHPFSLMFFRKLIKQSFYNHLRDN